MAPAWHEWVIRAIMVPQLQCLRKEFQRGMISFRNCPKFLIFPMSSNKHGVDSQYSYRSQVFQSFSLEATQDTEQHFTRTFRDQTFLCISYYEYWWSSVIFWTPFLLRRIRYDKILNRHRLATVELPRSMKLIFFDSAPHPEKHSPLFWYISIHIESNRVDLKPGGTLVIFGQGLSGDGNVAWLFQILVVS